MTIIMKLVGYGILVLFLIYIAFLTYVEGVETPNKDSWIEGMGILVGMVGAIVSAILLPMAFALIIASHIIGKPRKE